MAEIAAPERSPANDNPRIAAMVGKPLTMVTKMPIVPPIVYPTRIHRAHRGMLLYGCLFMVGHSPGIIVIQRHKSMHEECKHTVR